MMFASLFDVEAGAVTMISSWSVFGANTMRISSVFVGIYLSLSAFLPVLLLLCLF